MEGLWAEAEGEDAGYERVEGRQAGADYRDTGFEGGPECCFGVGFWIDAVSG